MAKGALPSEHYDGTFSEAIPLHRGMEVVEHVSVVHYTVAALRRYGLNRNAQQQLGVLAHALRSVGHRNTGNTGPTAMMRCQDKGCCLPWLTQVVLRSSRAVPFQYCIARC
jgi:hypothetical protein